MERHYCQVCKTEHSFPTDWPHWNSKVVNGKKIYWCNKGMDCAGCGRVHRRTAKIHAVERGGKVLWFCDKHHHAKESEIDWDQYSPAEVISGVPYGMPKVVDKDYEDWDQEKAKQEKAVDEVLTELEELEAQDRIEAW